MDSKCGKCKGAGGRERRKPKGTYIGLFGSSMEWVRCDVCGGSGVNPNYREKYCEYSGCSTKIGYHKDADHPPKYCSYHKGVVQQERTQRSQQPRHEQRPAYQQKPRQDDKWQEKPCPGLKGESGCSSRNTIRYRTDWSRIPDLCPDCIAKIKARKAENDAKWREKPCERPGCRNTIRYMVDWDHQPKICKECQQKGADLFRGDLIPSGWKAYGGKVTIAEGHITMFFKGMGTGGADYRVSWDGFGEAHYTDQGLPKGNPRRHRDPRQDH